MLNTIDLIAYRRCVLPDDIYSVSWLLVWRPIRSIADYYSQFWLIKYGPAFIVNLLEKLCTTRHYTGSVLVLVDRQVQLLNCHSKICLNLIRDKGNIQ